MQFVSYLSSVFDTRLMFPQVSVEFNSNSSSICIIVTFPELCLNTISPIGANMIKRDYYGVKSPLNWDFAYFVREFQEMRNTRENRAVKSNVSCASLLLNVTHYKSGASKFGFNADALKRANDKRLLRDTSGICNIRNVRSSKHSIIISVSLCRA